MEIPDRLTVVENVYHQTQGEDPFHISTTFERKLQTQEQPYSRTTSVGEEWEQLDCGWLGDNVGMLIIANNEGKFARIPTEEEREEVAKRVLIIGYRYRDLDSPACDAWEIPPGESFRGSPTNSKSLYIKSLSGRTKYTINLIPS